MELDLRSPVGADRHSESEDGGFDAMDVLAMTFTSDHDSEDEGSRSGLRGLTLILILILILSLISILIPILTPILIRILTLILTLIGYRSKRFKLNRCANGKEEK